MWWQHSRSAGVSVTPGSTHAIAGLATHISTMLSNKAARTLVTAIIIAFHHAMFENTGSVTPVTPSCVCDKRSRIRRYTRRTREIRKSSPMDSSACGCCGRPLFDQPVIRWGLAEVTLVRAFPAPLIPLVDFALSASLPLQPEFPRLWSVKPSRTTA